MNYLIKKQIPDSTECFYISEYIRISSYEYSDILTDYGDQKIEFHETISNVPHFGGQNIAADYHLADKTIPILRISSSTSIKVLFFKLQT